jgi:hypothetical protein
MTARFTLLFVCDNPDACYRFRQSLCDTGFQLISVLGIRSTTISSNEFADGVLVYQEDVRVGLPIALWLKTLFRNTPVVLISTGTMAPSFGIDAVCYAGALDDDMAGIVAMLFRDLLIQRPYRANVRLEHEDVCLRPFLVRP